jgi:hypothetical protein
MQFPATGDRPRRWCYRPPATGDWQPQLFCVEIAVDVARDLTDGFACGGVGTVGEVDLFARPHKDCATHLEDALARLHGECAPDLRFIGNGRERGRGIAPDPG